MTGWGDILLIVFAAVVGLGAQAKFRGRLGLEWIVTAVGAWLGGLSASQYSLAGLGGWGPDIAGLHVFPAIIGGLVLAGLAELGMRVSSRPAGTA